MDDARIGSALRQIRVRLGLRQVDVARRARVSDSTVSLIELGRLEAVSLEHIRAVARALGGHVDLALRWRGPELDRLLDAGHARLVGTAASALRDLGWDARLEVSYSIFGERGSIDVLGGRVDLYAAVVEEVKSDLVRVDDTIRKLDEKLRLTTERIALERFGWRPAVVGRVLVLPDTDRCRRQVARSASVLDVAFPCRGPEVRRWLRSPTGSMSGILFVADPGPIGATGGRVGLQRVRVPKRGVRTARDVADPSTVGVSDGTAAPRGRPDP